MELVKTLLAPVVNHYLHHLAGIFNRREGWPDRWDEHPLLKGENQIYETTDGDKAPVAKFIGRARVVSIHRIGEAYKVTFAHGRWARYSLYKMAEIVHEGDDVIYYLPDRFLLKSFSQSAFTITFYPFIKNGRAIHPQLMEGEVVIYEILSTNNTGDEGMLTGLEIDQT